jgi:hypothetical protein
LQVGEERENYFVGRFYKDVSPTGFEKLNPCFIRVHPWLKNVRVVRVFRGSPHPACGQNPWHSPAGTTENSPQF